MGGKLFGKIAQEGMVRPRHQQRVARIERLDIQERHGQLGLQHAGRGDLARDDLAEDTARIVCEIGHDAALPDFGREGLPNSHLGLGAGATTAGRVGALICSCSPSRLITAMAAASPWRTLASL